MSRYESLHQCKDFIVSRLSNQHAPWKGMMSFMVTLHSVQWFSFLLCSGSNKSQGKFSESRSVLLMSRLIENFQDAKFKQILKFDSVVIQGGGEYVHTT